MIGSLSHFYSRNSKGALVVHYHRFKFLFNMFLEIIVQLIPIFSSVDLLDVIQSVSIPPSQDANDVVDPARDFRFESN